MLVQTCNSVWSEGNSVYHSHLYWWLGFQLQMYVEESVDKKDNWWWLRLDQKIYIYITQGEIRQNGKKSKMNYSPWRRCENGQKSIKLTNYIPCKLIKNGPKSLKTMNNSPSSNVAFCEGVISMRAEEATLSILDPTMFRHGGVKELWVWFGSWRFKQR
jgi:hypothetical protein